MTVTYTAEVATCRGFGCFLKMLFRMFEGVVHYCETYSNLIPLSFVLGFYVSIDERGRMMRRTIMRYVCACQTLVFAMISPRVKKRFPTLDHFVEA
ncbi:hypothetical protein B566_EDAN015594, partial [Ephemera danica]